MPSITVNRDTPLPRCQAENGPEATSTSAKKPRSRSRRMVLSSRLLLLLCMLFLLGLFHIHSSQKWMKKITNGGGMKPNHQCCRDVTAQCIAQCGGMTVKEVCSTPRYANIKGCVVETILPQTAIAATPAPPKTNLRDVLNDLNADNNAIENEQVDEVNQVGEAAALLQRRQADEAAQAAADRRTVNEEAAVEEAAIAANHHLEIKARAEAAVAKRAADAEGLRVAAKQAAAITAAETADVSGQKFSFTGASWEDTENVGECFPEVSYGAFKRVSDKRAIIKTGIASLDNPKVRDIDDDAFMSSSVTCRAWSHPKYLKKDSTLCDLQNVAIDWTNVVRPRSHLWNSNIRYTLKDKAIALQIDNDVIEEAPDKQKQQQKFLLQKTLIHTANVAGYVDLLHGGERSLHNRCTEVNTMPAKLVMAVGRTDDHCPFFATSIILNAWMTLELLGVHPNDAQLMFMDDGDLAARHLPYDDMMKKALTPKHDIVYGGRGPMADHVGLTCFKRLVTIPSEYASPIMSRLDFVTPCRKSALIADFTCHVLQKTLGNSANPLLGESAESAPTTRRPRVTILYRRRHAQRSAVQRRIANENELTAAFENEPLFKGNVKALDFGASSWSFEHQAQVMRETDVLVGFHGAQLVNALWLPHGSTVIEVFARGHHRYTYDHISKYLGHSYVRIETHQVNEPPSGFTVPVAEVVAQAVAKVKSEERKWSDN